MMLALLLLPLLVGVRAGFERDGIIGGHRVRAHTKPWMACLFSKKTKSPKCGGVLVNEKFVLTAAHCNDPQDLTVILGVQNVRKDGMETWQHFENCKTHFFKSKPGVCNDDIMLLELLEPATLNKFVQLIPLPNGDNDIPLDTECNVAGWGWTAVDGEPSDELMETNVTIRSNKECKTNMTVPSIIQDTLLCTGDHKDGKDGKRPNVYDSGGPLVCNGVVEGIICGGIQNTQFALYTRISKYLPWIQRILRGSG